MGDIMLAIKLIKGTCKNVKKENRKENKNNKAKDAVVMRGTAAEESKQGFFTKLWSSQSGKLIVTSSAAVVVLGAALAATIAFAGNPAQEDEMIALKGTVPPPVLLTQAPVQNNVYAEDDEYQSNAANKENGGEQDMEPETVADPDVITSVEIPFDGVIEYGQHNDVLLEVQERLMNLCYMDFDEVTDYLGPITQESLSMFQRTYGLDITGNLDGMTYAALMSEGAPEYSVSEGADGEDVSELQSRLYELGYLKSKPSGYFGTDTLAAVTLFQENNGLEVNGKINVETRELLYSGDVVAVVWSSGDTSENITPYQERLYELGYLTNEPDGIYGDATIAAVKRFQDRNGLTADGRLGPQTMTTLMSEDAIPNSLALGMSGDDVSRVQARLHELKYLTSDMQTGYFGGVTDHAIRAFQKENGLTADGRVGKQTMSVLMSPEAKKAPSGYSQQSNSPSSSSSNSSSSQSSSSSKDDSYTPVPPASDQPSISNMIRIAKSRLGCRYVTGGKGDNKFDCSGFVYWVMKQSGFKQSYLTSYGWRSVTKYPKIKKISDLQAGDVIVFYGHVGLCVGDGEMIHASSSKGKVCYGSTTSSWAKRNFICGFRIFG